MKMLRRRVAALIVARQLTAPLKAMTESAERIAAGDLSERHLRTHINKIS